MLASLLASHKEVTQPTQHVTVLYIASNSQSAIKSLTDPESSLSLVVEYWEALENLATKKSVKLIWVPCHSGISGYEASD